MLEAPNEKPPVVEVVLLALCPNAKFGFGILEVAADDDCPNPDAAFPVVPLPPNPVVGLGGSAVVPGGCPNIDFPAPPAPPNTLLEGGLPKAEFELPIAPKGVEAEPLAEPKAGGGWVEAPPNGLAGAGFAEELKMPPVPPVGWEGNVEADEAVVPNPPNTGFEGSFVAAWPVPDDCPKPENFAPAPINGDDFLTTGSCPTAAPNPDVVLVTLLLLSL